MSGFASLLIGRSGSGKGEVAKYLNHIYGFDHFKLSTLVQKEAIQQGKDPGDRRQLQQVGDELRRTCGADILARRTYELILQNAPKYLVVESFRNPAEVQFLKDRLLERWPVVVLGLNVNPELQFQRLKEGKQYAEGVTDADIWEVIERDWHSPGIDGAGQDVEGCMKLIDGTIHNNGSLLELRGQVQEMLRGLGVLEELRFRMETGILK